MKKGKLKLQNTQAKDYQTISITSRFGIDLLPSPSFEELSSAKKRLINTIWEKEQKRRGGLLYEGTILSAAAYDKNKLSGYFVPYKYFLAQMCDPSLKQDLKILPVSVSGITLTVNNILVAMRASWLTQEPDRFELAPSGGIRPPSKGQPIDLKEQILYELVEEIHIEESSVKKIKFFALVRDMKNDGIELCAEILLKSPVILSSTSEYTQVLSLPKEEVSNFAKTHSVDFVPLSLHLLKLRKLSR